MKGVLGALHKSIVERKSGARNACDPQPVLVARFLFLRLTCAGLLSGAFGSGAFGSGSQLVINMSNTDGSWDNDELHFAGEVGPHCCQPIELGPSGCLALNGFESRDW